MPQIDTLVPGGYGNATGANSAGLPAGGDNITNQPQDLVIKSPVMSTTVDGLASTVPGATPFGNNVGAAIGNPFALAGTTGTNTVVPTATASGTVPGSSVGTLNPSSLFGLDANTLGQLKGYFGDALGGSLYNFLNAGAGYNPNVATAIANANAPYEQRSRANILESFGASGNRSSSPAAIGLGDFESNYALGQENIFANLFNNATNRYSDILGGLLNTAHLEQANKLGVSDILSGLLGIGSSGGGLLSSILKGLGIGGGSSSGGGAKPGGTGSPSGGNITTDAVANFINWLRNHGGTNITGNNPAGPNPIPNPTGGLPGNYGPGIGTAPGGDLIGSGPWDVINSILGSGTVPTYTGGTDTFGNTPTPDTSTPWGNIWDIGGSGAGGSFDQQTNDWLSSLGIDLGGGGSSGSSGDLSSLFGLGDLSNYAPPDSGGGTSGDLWSSIWDSGSSDVWAGDWSGVDFSNSFDPFFSSDNYGA